MRLAMHSESPIQVCSSPRRENPSLVNRPVRGLKSTEGVAGGVIVRSALRARSRQEPVQETLSPTRFLRNDLLKQKSPRPTEWAMQESSMLHQQWESASQRQHIRPDVECSIS